MKLINLIKHNLLKGSAVIFLGGSLTNILNYSYHLIVARALSPSQYGLLQSLVSLLFLANIFTGPLALSIINLLSSAKDSFIWPTIINLEKKIIKLSFVFWLGFLLLFPVFKNFLHLKNFYPFFIFSGLIFFSFLAIIYQATLQARLKFLEFSILGILTSLIKIILSLIFIFFGWKLYGALAGLVFSSLGTVILGRALILKYWRKFSFSKIAKKTPQIIKKANFWQYSLLTLITVFASTSIYSSDLLLVRHYFSPFQSGIYAAVSVLGKLIFFATSSILLVSFPLFIKFKNQPQKLKTTFLLSFLFVIIICFLAVTIYNLFPQFIVNLVYRQNYSQAIFYLPFFTVFIGLGAVFNLLVQLLLALGSKLAALLAVITATSQVLLILVRHTSLKIIISNSILSIGFGLLLGLLFVNKALNETKK